MAFDGEEFLGDTAQVVDVVGSALESTFLAGVFGLPTSILASLIGMLPAYFLGKALCRVREERIHIAAFAVLVLAAGVAVPFGQFAAVRRALTADSASVVSAVGEPVAFEQDAE